MRRPSVLACILLALVLAATGNAASAGASSNPGGGSLPLLCGYPYPSFTRFVIEDGGTDDGGRALRLCHGYQQLGGEPTLGLPVSRPFRVGSDLYQALEYGVLHWGADRSEVNLLDVMDVLQQAGRDATLEQMGIPPGQAPSMNFLIDPLLNEIYGPGVNTQYGLPTSPPVNMGQYVVQRYQHAILRRWLVTPPYDSPAP